MLSQKCPPPRVSARIGATRNRVESSVLLALLFIAGVGAVSSSHGQPLSTETQVDGSINAELIPDERVYAVLFRLIASRQGEQLSALRDYLYQTGIGSVGSETCQTMPLGESKDKTCSACQLTSSAAL